MRWASCFLVLLALGCGADPEQEAWLEPLEGGGCAEDCAPLGGSPLQHAEMCFGASVAFTCICGAWGGTGIPTCVEDPDGTQYRIGFGNTLFYEMGFAYCELPPWALTGAAPACP